MRREKIAGTTVHITGGADREGGGDGPLVVLLHGFGAPGNDLVPLWRVLDVPSSVRFAFPEAPIDLGPQYAGGRAWWRIDMEKMQRALAAGQERDLTSEIPEGIGEARAGVVACLDELEPLLSVPSGKLVLGGFSQGAMLSCDIALRTVRPLGALALMSGTMLAEKQWLPLMPARKGLRVVQSHGRADPLLPFSIAERLRDELRAAGVVVEWIPFNGGHQIPEGAHDKLGALVTELAGG